MKVKKKEKESPRLFSESLFNEWKSRYVLSTDLDSVSLLNYLQDENFEHIRKMVASRGACHPFIREVISHLQDVIIEENQKGISQLGKHATRHLKAIEKAFHHFLFDRIHYSGKPHKGILLLRKLEPNSTLDDSLKHFLRVYEKNKKQSRGNRREMKELKKERKQANKKRARVVESIKQTKEKLEAQSIKVKRVEDSPELKYYAEKKLETLRDEIFELESENQRWESAIQRLTSNILSLKEEQEKKGHKEARKRTLEYLAKKTGVRISNRSFEEILALANQLNLT